MSMSDCFLSLSVTILGFLAGRSAEIGLKITGHKVWTNIYIHIESLDEKVVEKGSWYIWVVRSVPLLPVADLVDLTEVSAQVGNTLACDLENYDSSVQRQSFADILQGPCSNTG